MPSSTTPLRNNIIYGNKDWGRGSNYAIPFESARYFQEKNFTSVAAEWNAKWGSVNNVLREASFRCRVQHDPSDPPSGFNFI